MKEGVVDTEILALALVPIKKLVVALEAMKKLVAPKKNAQLPRT